MKPVFSPVIIPLAIGAEGAELAEGVGVEFGPRGAGLFNSGLGPDRRDQTEVDLSPDRTRPHAEQDKGVKLCNLHLLVRSGESGDT